MTSIRKAKRQALRWDRYRFKIGRALPHPAGCCRAHSRWAEAQRTYTIHRRRSDA
jgi:hypothetical protein